jgi:hypothetical protein
MYVSTQIATPRLADMGSRQLPDSPMRGVRESTKGKIKALDLYVGLLLQASLVQLNMPALKKLYTSSFLAL